MSDPLTVHSTAAQYSDICSPLLLTAAVQMYPSGQYSQVPLTCWCQHKLDQRASGDSVLVFPHLLTDVFLVESLLLHRCCKRVRSSGSWTTQRLPGGWKEPASEHPDRMRIQTRYISALHTPSRETGKNKEYLLLFTLGDLDSACSHIHRPAPTSLSLLFHKELPGAFLASFTALAKANNHKWI